MIKDPRPLYIIAADIASHWYNTHYTAKPYLDAMRELNSINGEYGADSARDVVLYFLSNASTFRGPEARRIKAELNDLLDTTQLEDTTDVPH